MFSQLVMFYLEELSADPPASRPWRTAMPGGGLPTTVVAFFAFRCSGAEAAHVSVEPVHSWYIHTSHHVTLLLEDDGELIDSAGGLTRSARRVLESIERRELKRSAVQHFRVLARMTPGLKEELATLLMDDGKTVLM